ncbi:MAG TPA: biotin-dependent carboxyltransferase family protein [Candidatus Caccocola faecipullorum]|nr:biotin-dependent carboxyltransferase family protein [Candidatus Caccocola faecipullorum]
MTELKVRRAGMLTSVQDLGRWGFQLSGVPVAGAMDLPALRIGNAMLGNPEGAAALEVTLLGPELEVCGGGAAVFAGADLGFSVNGRAVGSWRVVELKSGDVISFTGPKNGCRGNLCFAGGVGVPLVMNSRSTYMRAKIGGFEGRALKNGDVITTGEPSPLWKRLDGFTLPPELNPALPADAPLSLMTGLQEDLFTEEGRATLFSSEYTITSESDRMGCRLDGAKIEHVKGGDIVSDGVPLGAVQIPSHGMPIVMLADRQTTGGYTKIGVLTPLSIEALVQKMPGSPVRFRKASIDDGTAEQMKIAEAVRRVGELRSTYVSRPRAAQANGGFASARLRLTVNGKQYEVTCEEIK